MTPTVAPAKVRPADRLRGRLRVPGDKSIAHRALIAGALSGGTSTVTVQAPGRDVRSTVSCLRALGVTVDEAADGDATRFAVTGRPTRDATLDCGNSGTTMRLLAGAIAGLPLRVTFDGDASLRGRPMERLAVPLRAAGAEVSTSDGHAPMTVTGRERLRATRHRLPVASAQLLGATALAGLSAEGETRIETPGPTRDHTERMLRAAGVAIGREGNVTRVVGPASPRPLDVTVPGDFSAAAAWIVAAVIHPDADVTVLDVGLNPTRTALIDVLRRMGADIEMTASGDRHGEPVGEVRARGGRRLRGAEVEAPEAASMIDELPLLAVAMAAAEGTSVVRGAGELRVKESDRIRATADGLRAIGASVEDLADGWRIERGSPRPATIEAAGDHRIAIAFGIAALAGVAASVELDDPDVVAVSDPTFWRALGEVST
jgi:3-phosphoshikimate 1-carboxyvinyltransferase